jgi:hypothetical protein
MIDSLSANVSLTSFQNTQDELYNAGFGRVSKEAFGTWISTTAENTGLNLFSGKTNIGKVPIPVKQNFSLIPAGSEGGSPM